MQNLNMPFSNYTPPFALTIISWISIGIAALAALWLIFDILNCRGWRTMMAIMIPVYVINALYLWPITVWTYAKYGKPDTQGRENGIAGDEAEPLLHSRHGMDHAEGRNTGAKHCLGGSNTLTHPQSIRHNNHEANEQHNHGVEQGPEAHRHHHSTSASRPMFASVTIATCHCGAGCVLGDIIGEWLVYRSNATIGGSMLYAAFIVDFALALAFGIVFQYFSIAPMAGDYGWKTIVRAAKADILSLTFFEIGLFGWMAIFDILIFDRKLEMNTAIYWFMMQVSSVRIKCSSVMLTLTNCIPDRHVFWTLDWFPNKLVVAH